MPGDARLVQGSHAVVPGDVHVRREQLQELSNLAVAQIQSSSFQKEKPVFRTLQTSLSAELTKTIYCCIYS